MNFSDKGEAFVEQKFLTPLLECLGYDSDEDYEVIRHGDQAGSFKLIYPPVEKGAKKVKHYNPDFIPTLRKKMFWIIEAKSPKVKYPFEEKYLVQGLQYCIHPEIQAAYLVISNGCWTSVYDAQRSVFFDGNIYEPIFNFHHKDIEAQWKDVYELLSAEGMRGILEKRLKEFYEKLALTSINDLYPEKLIDKIQENKFDVRAKIQANLTKKYVEHLSEKISTRNERLTSEPDDVLEKYMNQPSIGWGRKASEIFLERRIKTHSERDIYNCSVDYYNLSSIFKKEHIFIILTKLYNLSKDHLLKSDIKSFILAKVFERLSPLNEVEALGIRIYRKLIVVDQYDGLKREVLSRYDELPEIIKFGRYPRVIDFTYPWELMCHDLFFDKIRVICNDELILLVNDLRLIEEKINPDFESVKSHIPLSEFEMSSLDKVGIYGFIPSLKNIACNNGVFEYDYLDVQQKIILKELYE